MSKCEIYALRDMGHHVTFHFFGGNNQKTKKIFLKNIHQVDATSWVGAPRRSVFFRSKAGAFGSARRPRSQRWPARLGPQQGTKSRKKRRKTVKNPTGTIYQTKQQKHFNLCVLASLRLAVANLKNGPHLPGPSSTGCASRPGACGGGAEQEAK